jgi:hypothetical protein
MISLIVKKYFILLKLNVVFTVTEVILIYLYQGNSTEEPGEGVTEKPQASQAGGAARRRRLRGGGE